MSAQFIIKPLHWDANFMIIPNDFARDRSISDFTRTVILDICSRSENWETNVATIMKNFGVGRDRARAVLADGQKAGYIHAVKTKDEHGRHTGTINYISTSREELAKFVSRELHSLNVQGLENHSLEVQGLEVQGLVQTPQLKKEGTKEKKEPNIAQQAAPSADLVKACQEPPHAFPTTEAASATVAGKRKRAPATRGSAEFEAAWAAYKSASTREPGSKPKALAQFVKLSAADQALVPAAIQIYRAKCVATSYGRGEHRHMADMNRFFTDFFRQCADEVAPANDPAAEAAEILDDARHAVEYNEWKYAQRRGWNCIADFPAWVISKLSQILGVDISQGYIPLPAYA